MFLPTILLRYGLICLKRWHSSYSYLQQSYSYYFISGHWLNFSDFLPVQFFYSFQCLKKLLLTIHEHVCLKVQRAQQWAQVQMLALCFLAMCSKATVTSLIFSFPTWNIWILIFHSLALCLTNKILINNVKWKQRTNQTWYRQDKAS